MAEHKPVVEMDEQLQREIDAATGDQAAADQLMERSVTPPPAPAASPPAQGGAAAPAPAEGEARPAGAAEGPSEAGSDAEAGPGATHHEFRRGRIAAIRGDDVFVEITGEFTGLGKMQGVVPLTQFDRPPRLGSVMDFVVDHIDQSQGLVFLSREGAISRTTWDHLAPGQSVEARVVRVNKGGLELEMIGGIKAFMPASQIDIHHVDNLEDWAGHKVEARVTEIDRKSKRVLLSRRAHLEEKKARQRAKTLGELAVGQTREGVVSNVVDFGAFIDLGGVDGLAHVSDLSHAHIDKPSDVVKVGDAVTVKVLKFEPKKQRISLGIKQTQADPWEAVAQRLTPGADVPGRVTRTAKFGAFVEIEPGVDGLLPLSEMSWRRIHRAQDVVKPGDHVRLRVLEADPANKRLTLSLKQAGGAVDPWTGAEHKYPKHAVVEGAVTHTTEYGAFVELEPGVEGLIHISELADRRVGQVTDVVQPGQTYKLRVLGVDESEHKISLSLKQADKPAGEGEGPGGGEARRGGERSGAAEPTRARPKADKSKLRGGADLGGVGLGGISLDNVK